MAKASTLYIPSHISLGNHPKTRKLANRLGVSKVQAVGHLHFLWWWAMTYAQDGDVSRYDDEDLALAAEWDGDPAMFTNALREVGFLDQGSLHDWPEYGGKVIENRRANAEKQAQFRSRHGNESDSNRDVTVTSPSRNPLREDKIREDITPPISPPTPRTRNTADAARPPAGTRLSDDWQPTDIDRKFARDQGLTDRDIAAIAERFRDHWIAQPGQKGRKSDWAATWRNWIRRDIEDNKPRLRVVNGHAPKRLTPEEVASGLYDTF